MALRCFVAMALGHEDTDQVYDDLIAPTLRSRSVTPIRVDRIEFNEDIDDRIIVELEQCDFALADLTYARPSVYFEAGFAQRKVPVIYTCRKDHLSPKVGDDFGNYRVHFDLQMKNIIPWTSPLSRDFTKRLAKRIDRTITPILRAKEREQAERQEADQFSVLSVQDKIRQLFQIGVTQFETTGYVAIVGETDRLRGYGFPIPIPFGLFDRWQTPQLQFRRILSIEPRWLGMKRVGRTIRTVFFHLAPSITKKLLAALDESLVLKPIYNISPQTEGQTISLLDEHLFVCSLQKARAPQVMVSLPEFHYEPNNRELIRHTKQIVPKAKIPGYSEVYALVAGGPGEKFLLRNRNEPVTSRTIFTIQGRTGFRTYENNAVGHTRTVSRHTHVHIIDAIKSEGAFRSTLSAVLNNSRV